MRSILGTACLGLLILSVAGAAFAGAATVPEPGVLELFAIGAVAAIAAKLARPCK